MALILSLCLTYSFKTITVPVPGPFIQAQTYLACWHPSLAIPKMCLALFPLTRPDPHPQADVPAQLHPIPREVPIAQGWVCPWLPLGLPCSLDAMVGWVLSAPGEFPPLPTSGPWGATGPAVPWHWEWYAIALLWFLHLHESPLSHSCKKSKYGDLLCNFG